MAVPWLPPDDMAGLRLSSTTIRYVTDAATRDGSTNSSSSSSSSSSTNDTVLGTAMESNQMLQRVVRALSERVGVLETNQAMMVEEYNFICQELLTDVLRIRLGEWQRERASRGQATPSADAMAAAQSMLRQYRQQANLGGTNEEEEDEDPMVSETEDHDDENCTIPK